MLRFLGRALAPRPTHAWAQRRQRSPVAPRVPAALCCFRNATRLFWKLPKRSATQRKKRCSSECSACRGSSSVAIRKQSKGPVTVRPRHPHAPLGLRPPRVRRRTSSDPLLRCFSTFVRTRQPASQQVHKGRSKALPRKHCYRFSESPTNKQLGQHPDHSRPFHRSSLPHPIAFSAQSRPARRSLHNGIDLCDVGPQRKWDLLHSR